MITQIDHTVAEFNKSTLVRGYYCQSAPSAGMMIYGHTTKTFKKSRDIHVIIHDVDGFWEFTINTMYSVEHYIDGLARDNEGDSGEGWYASLEDCVGA